MLRLDDLVSETTSNGETKMHLVRDTLNDKHPLTDPTNPIMFDGLNADTIFQATMHTQGAAGPSGLDAQAWRHMCSSFKSASTSLCTALPGVGKRISTTLIHPEGLSALVACRLIPLNKCPGVRPIGVGEVPRRIIAKGILRIISSDVEAAAGLLQLCASQDGGCEAAVHAMRKIFKVSCMPLPSPPLSTNLNNFALMSSKSGMLTMQQVPQLVES